MFFRCYNYSYNDIENENGKDDKAEVFKIISRHGRFLAATRLEMTEAPVEVLSISKEEANIIFVDSNLHQEHVLPK